MRDTNSSFSCECMQRKCYKDNRSSQSGTMWVQHSTLCHYVYSGMLCVAPLCCHGPKQLWNVSVREILGVVSLHCQLQHKCNISLGKGWKWMYIPACAAKISNTVLRFTHKSWVLLRFSYMWYIHRPGILQKAFLNHPCIFYDTCIMYRHYVCTPSVRVAVKVCFIHIGCEPQKLSN